VEEGQKEEEKKEDEEKTKDAEGDDNEQKQRVQTKGRKELYLARLRTFERIKVKSFSVFFDWNY